MIGFVRAIQPSELWHVARTKDKDAVLSPDCCVPQAEAASKVDPEANFGSLLGRPGRTIYIYIFPLLYLDPLWGIND